MSSLGNNVTPLKLIYHYDNRAYEVLREIPLHNFHKKDGSIVAEYFNAWKDHLGADHVLKTQTHFIFCKTIQDIEWEDVK